MKVNQNRKWTWLDTFIFFARTAWIFYNANWVLSVTSGSAMKLTLLIWFLSLYLIPYLFYRPGFIRFSYFIIAEAILTGGMFVYLAARFQILDVYNFINWPIITIAYACQRKPFVWIGPIVCIGMFTVGTWAGNLFYNQDVIVMLFDTALFYGIGAFFSWFTVLLNRNKELIETIEEKNRTLEQYSNRIEELTIMEERNRVAQDLHDTVGHIFTSVITSLDALPFIMKKNTQEAEKSIREISSLARKGLTDVRETIHQLSPLESHQPLSSSMLTIIDDFRKHTNTKVDFKLYGIEKETSERMKYTLTRCLQEGLTNAKRHGEANKIDVSLVFEADVLIIRIKDYGKGADSIQLGFGLHTMKDRLSTFNGSLSIESKLGHGTEFVCRIPLIKDVVVS